MGRGVPDRWWRRFYSANAVLLAVSALAMLWLFHATRLDLRLAAPYYDAANRAFPWRYAWSTKYLVHHYLKYTLLVAGLATWLIALRGRFLHRWPRPLIGHERRWRVVALSFLLVPAVIGLLHRASAMHCPWDVTDFGGRVAYFDLLGALPRDVAPGHCFPAAFVASGSWLLALALLWLPGHRLRSAGIGVAALALGFGLGWVQQMRGAHFLSHTLWSLWWSWLVVLVLHAATGGWRERD
jgi:membrane-associated PAP2 superfamily phosphatase